MTWEKCTSSVNLVSTQLFSNFSSTFKCKFIWTYAQKWPKARFISFHLLRPTASTGWQFKKDDLDGEGLNMSFASTRPECLKV